MQATSTRQNEIVSPSLLLLPIPESTPISPDFDLGMADWLSDSTVPRPPQQKRLRLTRACSGGTTPLGESTNGQSNSRFSKSVDSPERLKACCPSQHRIEHAVGGQEFHRLRPKPLYPGYLRSCTSRSTEKP